MKQKLAYTALGFIMGWYINKPVVWFTVGATVGTLITLMLV